MLATTSAPSSGPFASAAASQAPQTLSELDERLAAGLPGVLLARAPRGVTEALLAHAARRAKGAGRLAVIARAHEGVPLWQEVAFRLGAPRLACSPARCAEQIATAALLRRALIVAPLPVAGSWDRAVAVELAALASPPSVLFVSDGADAAGDIAGERFEVTATLDEGEKRRWWSAVADEARAMLASDDLAQLDSWWSAVKRASVAEPTSERGGGAPRARSARSSRRSRSPGAPGRSRRSVRSRPLGEGRSTRSSRRAPCS